MPPTPGPARRPLLAAAGFLLLAGGFAAGYCQAPLYYQNQNQYFLHGLADAGVGLLRDDWLANTRDPTPAFSALVTFTARYLHPWAFYLYYALLLGAYASALLGLFASLAGEEATRRWPAFLALLLACHSAVARWASYRWLGQDYPWYLQSGVAGQYLLGPTLQPSAFGVLLVVAICLFVRGRHLLAVVCAALAATVHPTYLLLAGLLTLGFMVALVMEGRGRKALGLGALALALVLPTLLHAASAFRPTSPEQFAEAQDILVNFRIPHHARVDLWLDPVAGLQIAWVVLGLALAWRTRLFPILAVIFVGGLVLTLAQVATGNRTLALLFPWRVSAVLVPVATGVVLARVVALRALPLDGWGARVASGVAILGLVAGGVWISANRLAFYTSDEELPVMGFVARTKRPGDVYFLPVRVPKLASTVRGSFKSDFKPLPEKQSDVRLIPMDFERFRLSAGAPVFVDFKSIPYKDTDVLQWRERIRLAEAVQGQLKTGRLGEAFAGLRRRGITHLVLPADQRLRSPEVEQVYADASYLVYRLRPASPSASGRVQPINGHGQGNFEVPDRQRGRVPSQPAILRNSLHVADRRPGTIPEEGVATGDASLMPFQRPAATFAVGSVAGCWATQACHGQAVSGDALFVEVQRQDGRQSFLLVDVCGHGAPAAALVALLENHLLQDPRCQNRSPAELLQTLHGMLQPAFAATGRFVAALALRADGQTGGIQGGNAALPVPHVGQPGGGWHEWPLPGGPPLGLPFPDAAYVDAALSWGVGEQLLAFTDGVSEAGATLGYQFQHGPFQAFLGRLAVGLAADQVVARLIQALRHHVPVNWPEDDTTVVCLRRT